MICEPRDVLYEFARDLRRRGVRPDQGIIEVRQDDYDELFMCLRESASDCGTAVDVKNDASGKVQLTYGGFDLHVVTDPKRRFLFTRSRPRADGLSNDGFYL